MCTNSIIYDIYIWSLRIYIDHICFPSVCLCVCVCLCIWHHSIVRREFPQLFQLTSFRLCRTIGQHLALSQSPGSHGCWKKTNFIAFWLKTKIYVFLVSQMWKSLPTIQNGERSELADPRILFYNSFTASLQLYSDIFQLYPNWKALKDEMWYALSYDTQE